VPSSTRPVTLLRCLLRFLATWAAADQACKEGNALKSPLQVLGRGGLSIGCAVVCCAVVCCARKIQTGAAMGMPERVKISWKACISPQLLEHRLFGCLPRPTDTLSATLLVCLQGGGTWATLTCQNY